MGRTGTGKIAVRIMVCPRSVFGRSTHVSEAARQVDVDFVYFACPRPSPPVLEEQSALPVPHYRGRSILIDRRSMTNASPNARFRCARLERLPQLDRS